MLISLWQDKTRVSADVKRLALAHVAEIEAKIAELTAMRDTVDELAAACDGDHRRTQNAQFYTISKGAGRLRPDNSPRKADAEMLVAIRKNAGTAITEPPGRPSASAIP